MQIDLFREFITLAEELNFHTAASRLNITQSTLSKHISQLEREYGAALFRRDRFGVALTGTGAVLLESARVISEEYERSRGLVASSAQRTSLFVSGELDNPNIVETVSRAVDIFTRKFPSCTPSFLPFPTAALDAHIAGLLSGDADVTVLKFDKRALAERPDAKLFCCRVIKKLQVYAMMSPRNPLAAKKGLHLADLAGCTFTRLVGPRFTPSWKVLERQLHRANLPFSTAPVAANSTLDCLNLDLRSEVLLTPDFTFAPRANMAGRAVSVPIDPAELGLDLCALSLKGHQEELVDGFVEAMARACDEREGAGTRQPSSPGEG